MNRLLSFSIVAVVLFGATVPLYEDFIEPMFTFSDEYHANWWYVWVGVLERNIQLLLALGVIRYLVKIKDLILVAASEAALFSIIIDTMGMAWLELEQYDRIWWQISYFSTAILISAILTIPRKKKRLREAENMRIREMEEEDKKAEEWIQ